MLRFHCLLTVVLGVWLSGCGEGGQATPESAARPEQDTAKSEAPIKTTELPPCALVMGWDPWEPYQYEITGGQVFGLDVDLVTAVTRQADCTLTFKKGSWRELLQQLRVGEIDLLAGATATEEREAFARFTTPYRDEQFEFFTRADRLESSINDDLVTLMSEGWRVGVVEGYLYTDAITGLQDQAPLNAQFVYSSMAETNMSRLLEGVVDGVIEDKYVGAAIIRHKNLQEDIKVHPMRFDRTQTSIMVSRASVDEALFQRLDESVRTLRASGAIDKVLAQYGEP